MLGEGDSPYAMDFGGENVERWMKRYLIPEEWERYRADVAAWLNLWMRVTGWLWWLPYPVARAVADVVCLRRHLRMEAWTDTVERRSGEKMPTPDAPAWQVREDT